jgi:hypothetical protein
MTTKPEFVNIRDSQSWLEAHAVERIGHTVQQVAGVQP